MLSAVFAEAAYEDTPAAADTCEDWISFGINSISICIDPFLDLYPKRKKRVKIGVHLTWAMLEIMKCLDSKGEQEWSLRTLDCCLGQNLYWYSYSHSYVSRWGVEEHRLRLQWWWFQAEFLSCESSARSHVNTCDSVLCKEVGVINITQRVNSKESVEQIGMQSVVRFVQLPPWAPPLWMRTA